MLWLWLWLWLWPALTGNVSVADRAGVVGAVSRLFLSPSHREPNRGKNQIISSVTEQSALAQEFGSHSDLDLNLNWLLAPGSWAI